MNRSENRFGNVGVFSRMVVVVVLAICVPFWADDVSSAESPMEEKSFRGGGEFKLIGSGSWPGSGTLSQPQGEKTFFDGLAEGRLKGQLFLTDWADFEAHYVIGATGGDTRKAMSNSAFPVYLGQGDIPGTPPSDKRQLFNMSWTPVDDKDFVFYHRVDRLALTIQRESALLRVGRQAITWGNGLIFNPMDLINPFSPADVVREYKVGQDMAFAQISAGSYANVQFLYAPRRDPDTGNVKEDQSAFAGKLHLGKGKTEFEIMAAKNFGERIIGAGGTGYLGDAAWRIDVIQTWLDDEGHRAYLSAVANLDYSWRWWGKNWYGFVEVFYSGIGEKDYPAALNNPDIQKKMSEGQLFTLGRWYADGSIRLELHPLFNTYLTVISNVADPSCIVQPRVSWDFASSFKLTIWGNIAFGRDGTEYGGFKVPGMNLDRKPPNGAFAWVSYYF